MEKPRTWKAGYGASLHLPDSLQSDDYVTMAIIGYSSFHGHGNGGYYKRNLIRLISDTQQLAVKTSLVINN